MILRHKDLDIPKDGSDPFKECKLKRKQYASILTQIVSNYADGFVLAINNPWGEGKTTFVKMWKQELINQGYTTLYYNAWENDFEKDILVALISELGEIENKPIKTFNKVLDKVVPLTSKLIPLIFKHLAKKTIGDEATEAIIEGVAEYGSEELKQEIHSYTSKKKSIDDFKDNLEVFVNEVSKGKPIVFIIDELDRCRPNYAVEVLEQIKHLFSVSGIVFVLSIDKRQLGYAVKGAYGNDNIDADEYLRRFIDIEYSIPKPDMQLLCEYFYDYYQFDAFFQSERRKRLFSHDTHNFLELSKLLFDRTNLRIRQVEKIFILVKVALKTFRVDSPLFPELLLLMIFLKNHHETIYTNIKNKTYSLQELVNEVENILPDKMSVEGYSNVILYTILRLAVFYYNYFQEGEYPQVPIYKKTDENTEELLFKSKFDKSEGSEELLHLYHGLKSTFSVHMLKIEYIFKKIDLMEQVNT